MEITGRNKLIVRETNREKTKVFEAELDLDLKSDVMEEKVTYDNPLFPIHKSTKSFKIGYVSCKGIVVTKNIEYTHEEAIANVNSVFAETLNQAFRGLDETFTSQVTYSFSIIKSSSPLLVTIEMNLTTENKIKFEVVTSAGTYEDCYLNAKKLMREFIEELQKQIGEIGESK